MKATRHNGRSGKHGSYNPKHNDRQFDISHSEHIDGELALQKRLNLSETQIKRLIKELVNEGLLKKRSGGFNKPNHLFVILPGEQKGTTGETTNGTTVGAKKAPLTVHKGPTNYYNKTLDETTYT